MDKQVERQNRIVGKKLQIEIEEGIERCHPMLLVGTIIKEYKVNLQGAELPSKQEGEWVMGFTPYEEHRHPLYLVLFSPPIWIGLSKEEGFTTDLLLVGPHVSGEPETETEEYPVSHRAEDLMRLLLEDPPTYRYLYCRFLRVIDKDVLSSNTFTMGKDVSYFAWGIVRRAP